MEPENEQLATQLAHLQVHVQALQARLDQRPATPETVHYATTTPVVTHKRPRAPPSNLTFDGTPSKAVSFWNQLKTYYVLEGDAFRSDQERIAQAYLLMSGPAAQWLEPYIESPTRDPTLVTDFTNFETKFKARFCPVDRLPQARAKLLNCKQGKRTVSDFANDFMTHAAVLSWADNVLLPLFLEGLNQDIRLLLIGKIEETSTLQMSIDIAIKLDNLVRLVSSSTKNVPAHPFPRAPKPWNPTPVVPVGGPVPMELDAMGVVRGRLTPQERERRRTGNLCMYCGNSGHYADRCTVKKTRVNALQTIPPEPVNQPETPAADVSGNGNGQ